MNSNKIYVFMYSRFDEILQKEIINVKIYSLKFLNFGAIISILSFEEKNVFVKENIL